MITFISGLILGISLSNLFHMPKNNELKNILRQKEDEISKLREKLYNK